MVKIESRPWVAVWYRCPRCGAQSAETMLSPWRYLHRQPRECQGRKCDHVELAVAERRWYTTFAIEPGVSFTTIAGTLAAIGPFRVCDIVQPNVRAFRQWYRQRRAEADEKARQYFERERQIEAEWSARRERQRQEAILLREVEAVAYRRAHAVELAAEQVARAFWPAQSRPALPASSVGED